ncbi:MAG: HD domain-containing protein [Patescibacteria group bacterium]
MENQLKIIRLSIENQIPISLEVWSTICADKFNILSLPKVKILSELDKIILSKHVRNGLNLLMDSGLLGVLIPELSLQKNYDQNTPFHDFTLWEHTLNVIEAVPQGQLDLRWSALLHDIAKPFTRVEKANGNSGYRCHELLGSEMAVRICSYLNFPQRRIDYITNIVRHHLNPTSPLKKYDDGGKKIKQDTQVIQAVTIS